VAVATPARLGRPPRIGREDILDVLDRHADGAWTMASIAAELGVSEAAIYYYYPTKGDLLAALGQRMLADFELPKLAGDWAAWLRQLGHQIYDFVRRHPFLADLGNSYALAPSFAIPNFGASEEMLSGLVAAGFTLTNAATASSLVLLLGTQYAAAAISWIARGAQLRQEFTRLAEAQPDTLLGQLALTISDEEPARQSADALDVALSIVIAGVRSELIDQPSPKETP